MRIRQFFSNNAWWIILTVAGVIAVAWLIIINQQHEDEKTITRSMGVAQDSIDRDRECVPVELSQLNELVSVVKVKQKKDLGNMGMPQLFETYISIDLDAVTPNGKKLLMGNPNNKEKWGKWFINDSYLALEYEIIGEDTVVYCPVYTFVQLVDLYEH